MNLRLPTHLLVTFSFAVSCVACGGDIGAGGASQPEPDTDIVDDGGLVNTADDAGDRSDSSVPDTADDLELPDVAEDLATDSGPEPDAVVSTDTDGSDVLRDAEGDIGEDIEAPDIGLDPDVSPDLAPDLPAPRCEAYPTCSTVEPSAGSVTEHQMEALEGCAFGLVQTEDIAANRALFDEVLARVGGASSLSDVLANLNRVAQPGITSGSADRLRNHDHLGFRWNSGDMGTTAWYPQGISGGSDRQADGRPLGRRLLLVSWYDHDDAAPVKGVRVSLADITNTSDIDYRHMLLVVPTSAGGTAGFESVVTESGNPLHGGGIVWLGDLLYVADTGNGFRVFDMSRILRVPDVDDSNRIGVTSTRIDAHAYRYAIPQIARYRTAPGACAVRHSFAGLDRTSDPPHITSGEYHRDDVLGRLASWPVDLSTGWLVEEEGDGHVRGIDAVVGAQTKMQGGLTYQGNTYISSSSQAGSLGRLYRTRVGLTSSISAWVYGCEDLYMERDTNRIWTAAEHPDARDTVSIHRLDP